MNNTLKIGVDKKSLTSIHSHRSLVYSIINHLQIRSLRSSWIVHSGGLILKKKILFNNDEEKCIKLYCQ